MKKYLIAFAFIICVAFATDKRYKVELTEQQANTLLYIIDKSTAEHVAVKEMQDLIIKQLTDTTIQKK